MLAIIEALAMGVGGREGGKAIPKASGVDQGRAKTDSATGAASLHSRRPVGHCGKRKVEGSRGHLGVRSATVMNWIASA